jgi:microcystin-dependent protein
MDRAGTQAATGNMNLGSNKITNLASGTVSTDAATYGQLTTTASTNTPTGVINMFSGAAAPTGWLICNGTAVSRTTYSALWDVLRNGTSSSPYGNGDGSTTFNLPNLQQKFPLGKSASGTGANLGDTGGAIDHTHTNYGHYHSITGAGSTLSVDITHNHGTSGVTGTVGGSDGTHNHSEGEIRVNDDGTGAAYRAFGRVASQANQNISSSGSGHGHGFSLTAAGQTLGATPKSPTGSIGNVTGAKNGDSDQATSTNNPPYLVVNFIIKT